MPTRARRAFGSVISRPGRQGFYLRIRDRGQQRIRYSGLSKTVANEQLSRIHAAIARGLALDAAVAEVLGAPRHVLSAPRLESMAPTFAEVAERYLQSAAREKRESTVTQDRNRLDVVLRAAWAKKPISMISKGEVAIWIDELGAGGNDGKGLAPSTLNRYRSAVSVVFEYAIERDLIETNPARGLRRADESRRAREVFLTVEQFWALVESAPAELRLMIAIAAFTGLRQGAVREVRWRHLDLVAGTLLAEASYAKGAKPQLFHLDAAIVQALREMKDLVAAGAERVFLTQTGRPWTRGWVCQLMRRAVDSCAAIPADVRPKVTFHALRHTFASLLEQDGLSPRKLQEALAHSDANLTRRYTHLNSEAMKEVGQRMGRLLKLDRLNLVREGYHRGYQAPSAS